MLGKTSQQSLHAKSGHLWCPTQAHLHQEPVDNDEDSKCNSAAEGFLEMRLGLKAYIILMRISVNAWSHIFMISRKTKIWIFTFSLPSKIVGSNVWCWCFFFHSHLIWVLWDFWQTGGGAESNGMMSQKPSSFRIKAHLKTKLFKSQAQPNK